MFACLLACLFVCLSVCLFVLLLGLFLLLFYFFAVKTAKQTHTKTEHSQKVGFVAFVLVKANKQTTSKQSNEKNKTITQTNIQTKDINRQTHNTNVLFFMVLC